MSLRRTTLLLLIGLLLLGLSEPSKDGGTLVSKDVIMPTLFNYLMRQAITIKVPHYMENNFAIVFDELTDLKPEERRLVDNLKLRKVRLKDIEIRVKFDELSPVNSGRGNREQLRQHFVLNEKNNMRCKIKSFRMKADLKITRKGRDIFGNKLPPIKATIDRFELKDIDSLFSFYLVKSGNDYYAKEMALKHMVLSPKASIKIREFPPIINKIISDIIGPIIADVGNKEVLNDAFYNEFNAHLPPRIPESGSPTLPSIFQDILN